MVSALDFRSSCPGLSPGRGQCVVFLGKTLNSHSASLYPAAELQICPGLTANKIQIPYDKHHKVSSLVKSHQNTHNSVKYEVI